MEEKTITNSVQSSAISGKKILILTTNISNHQYLRIDRLNLRLIEVVLNFFWFPCKEYENKYF